MKVVEIREEAEWQQLSAGWEALLRDSASSTIFLTWEWLTAWWSTYAQAGELRLLAAFDDNGALRGVAPLRSQIVRKYGQRVPALTFIGDGSNDSDYLDFLIARGCEPAVMDAFRGHLAKELSRGTVLLLNEIPEQSPNLPLLKNLANSESAIWTEADTPCGVVQLPETWEEYLKILRPRFRTKVRSVLRNVEVQPEVRFGFCNDAEQIGRLLAALFDLHSRRWTRDGKPGVFGQDRKRRFYEALSPLLLERGRLRFSWMEWNGRVLACQYGFVYEDTYSQLQEGYEPASEHWNVGIALRAWSIRELLKQGVRKYDFLAGAGRSKTDWGAQVEHSKRIVIASQTFANALFCRGPEWEARARESARKILPERVLSARREWLGRRAASKTQNGHVNGGTGSSWMRNAAAQCYFHLGFPAIVRPFRNRYQLSSPPSGKLPRISKRTAASGRILYYHRVNDDGDPFFPATPTALFQQEMQYLARHNKVVSLPALLEHLESGSPETVLAITFDDGYEDNYQNAFPILERYGLPATIFLSTGSIDSREPLWFEQLAHALKTTANDTIDLEIDVPRRFTLGTETERLAANAQIFAVLRQLQDSDRQRWLADILERLGVPLHLQPAGKMLTWDQVRAMSQHKIDFGGHTVTHPFMSKLARAQAEWQVSECKRRIECELQRPVGYFAYPNGREEDFSEWNKELIRLAGYRGALTTIWGANDPGTDRMELRRGGPWEDNLAGFAYKLDWYELTNG